MTYVVRVEFVRTIVGTISKRLLGDICCSLGEPFNGSEDRSTNYREGGVQPFASKYWTLNQPYSILDLFWTNNGVIMKF